MVSQMICRLLEELVEEANYSVFYWKKLLFYIQKYAKVLLKRRSTNWDIAKYRLKMLRLRLSPWERNFVCLFIFFRIKRHFPFVYPFWNQLHMSISFFGRDFRIFCVRKKGFIICKEIKSTFTWHLKWTQTSLKSQTTLKCCSVYMAIYMAISLQQLSKQ